MAQNATEPRVAAAHGGPRNQPNGRPGSAGIAFFVLTLVALSPFAFVSGYLPALLISVALSLTALFALASRVFTPSHFNLRAGLESVAVGGAAAGFLYALGLIMSSA